MTKNLYLLFSIVLAIGLVLPAHAQTTTRIITTFAGSGIAGYSGDGGAATLAKLDSPSCLAIDGSGSIYVNDQRNNCIRKVDPSGIITTIAGMGTSGFSGDNGPATAAKLNLNWGVAADAAGNVYITDQVNYRVRKVNTSGIITTIAGTGVPGFKGDGGQATDAKFQAPLGIAVDASGNVYIGDPSNFRIRKVSASGIVTTVAGNGLYGFSGDGGPATSAELSYIWGLAVDGPGNLYVCDGANNRIRKINTAGIISTFAGNGAAGYTGDGGLAVSATLNQPLGVFVHSSGEVYISDCHNNCIRKVNTSGIISTVAGTGGKGFDGNGGPATAAQLFHPISTTMDARGNIYLTDLDNVRVRKISATNTLSFTGGRNQILEACENTSSSYVNKLLTIIDYDAGLTDTWSLLSAPQHGSISISYSITSSGREFTPGVFHYVPASGYIGGDTFVVRVSNGIMSDTTTIYTVVNTTPSAGTITGASRVCVASSIALTNTISGGFWSSSNASASVKGGVVTGISPGTDTIIYIVTNICGIDIATMPVTIDSLPLVGGITGPDALCEGSSITLSENHDGGVWSSSNGYAIVDSGVVTGLFHGSAIIKYTITDSFCSAVTKHNITIDSFPDAGLITGLTAVCIGSETIISASSTGGIWSSCNANAAVSPIPAKNYQSKVTGISAGMDTVFYYVTNSCGTDTASQTIAVNPLPVVPTVIKNENDSVRPAFLRQ